MGSREDGSELWTRQQNAAFENALARHDQSTPDRWQKISRELGKPVEEVMRHYQRLYEDVNRIETGQAPIYWCYTNGKTRG